MSYIITASNMPSVNWHVNSLRQAVEMATWIGCRFDKQIVMVSRNGLYGLSIEAMTYFGDGSLNDIKSYRGEYVHELPSDFVTKPGDFGLGESKSWQAIEIGEDYSFVEDTYHALLGMLASYHDHYPKQVLIASRDGRKADVTSIAFDREGNQNHKDLFKVKGLL